MNKFLSNLFIPLLLFLCAACVTEEEPGNLHILPGDALPVFSITLSSGEEVSSEELRGKVAVIEFFNTSCKDCRESFPILQTLYEEFRENDNVRIIAIARAEEAESIQKYWVENSLSIPWAAQPDRTIFSLFADSGIPRLFISDRNGIVRFAFDETTYPDAASLTECVESLLRYNTPSSQEDRP